MQMTGEYRIPAPRQAVWDALNDPQILKQCIPGCEEMTKTDEGGFEAKVTAKVGPVRAKFGGKVELSDMDPPSGYTISGQGTGGAAGFAKGGAKVSLTENGGETVLSYTVDASVGGKLAQIGSRLIDATAKKMADDFFSKLAEIVGEGALAGEAEALAVAKAAPAERPAAGIPAYIWVGGIIAAVIILLLLFAR